MARKDGLEVGAVYGVYVDLLGKYGAYQVVEVESGSVCYVVLDYLEPEPPKAESLSDLQPFYQERFRYHHELDMKYIQNDQVPKDYIYIGSCPPVTTRSCSIYAGNEWGHGMEYVYEMDWQEADAGQRQRYKKYINSGDWVNLKEGSFRKNQSVLTTEIYEAVGQKFSVELFPCITDVEIQGANPGILDCIEDASLIRTLRWKDPQTEVLDFRNTRLRSFVLDGTGVKQIFLPAGVRSLNLTGRLDPDLQVTGETMGLALSMKDAGLSDYGLLHVRKLFLGEIEKLDLGKLPALFPELRALSLTGHPGTLKNLKALGDLAFLRELTIWDLFGYSAEDLQVLGQIPELRSLDLNSIPKEAGLAVRKTWKGKLDYLEVRKLRSEEWLKENLENPFRHWDGSEFVPTAAYKKTMQQYKKTKKQLAQIRTKEDALAAAEEYGRFFNGLNRRYNQFIETEEREDIFQVLELLYHQCLKNKNLMELEDFLDALDKIRDEW